MCPQRVIHTPPLAVECTHGRDTGSTCNFSCAYKDGQLRGPSQVHCMANTAGLAEWDDNFPKCERK